MKRLFLFMILFCSGIVVLMLFMEEEEAVIPDLLPDVPETVEAPPDPSGAGEEAGAPATLPTDSVVTNGNEEGPPAQASVRDFEWPRMVDYVEEDGTVIQVPGELYNVGYMEMKTGSNICDAEDVKIKIYDRTPARRVVARVSSKAAVFFSKGDRNDILGNSEFHSHFILKDNVEVRLVGERPKAGGPGGETVILSQHIVIEEDMDTVDPEQDARIARITSPLESEDGGHVRIISSEMDISGRGMTVDLVEKTLAFEKDIVISGTEFKIPELFPGEGEAAPGTPPVGKDGTAEAARDGEPEEPIVIRCGGPFLFAGVEAADVGGRDAASSRETTADSLLSSGTLSFTGGVTATRGANRLDCDTLFIRFDEDTAGSPQLSTFKAISSRDRQTVMTTDSGVVRSRDLEWFVTEAGSRSILTGRPVIEDIVLPSVGAEGGDDVLYVMSAEKEITLDASVDEEAQATGLEVLLTGAAEIRPAVEPENPDKSISIAGETILLSLKSKDESGGRETTDNDSSSNSDESAEGDDSASLGAFMPEEIRITGNARVTMQGQLEADEIVMTMESGKDGLRQVVTLDGDAVLSTEDFRLESTRIVIRTIPGVVTRISTAEGFDMDLSLEGFSGAARDTAAADKTTNISAEGDGILELWWPDAPAGGEPADHRNMRINGPYDIRIDMEDESRIVMRGNDRFTMGTNLHEGALITSLELTGSPHMSMARRGQERMALDCREAYIDLDHSAAEEPEEAEPAEPGGILTPESDPQSGFFTTSIVRRIQALHDVRLKYGSSRIRCDSIDWDLPDDRMVAEGGGEPVTLETVGGGMRLTGSRFLLKPEREEWTILDPEAFFEKKADDGDE